MLLTDFKYDNTNASTLSKIKAVDGVGSGLDADTIDGLDSTALALVNGSNLNNFKVKDAINPDEAPAFGQFTGYVLAFATSAVPAGFLECNGAALSRTVYASLFAILGTTYGVGDGSTTFNIPDLRGEFIRGFDNGRGVDAGRVVGSNQAEDIAPHVHNIAGSAGLFNAAGGTGIQTVSGNTTTTTYNAGNIGAGIGTETRPRNVAMMYCIKY